MRKFTIYNLQFTIIAFICTLYIVHCTFFVSPVYAFENDIGYSRITPASPFYFLKTIREDLELKFAGTPRVKLLRELEFATVRIREVKTLIPINQDLIAPTLENYGLHLRNLNNILQDKDLDVKIAEGLNTHVKVLMQVYGAASNLKAKMAIRLALNKLIQRVEISDTQKLAVCNLFYQEASQSSLNQTEKFVIIERARKCKNISQ